MKTKMSSIQNTLNQIQSSQNKLEQRVNELIFEQSNSLIKKQNLDKSLRMISKNIDLLDSK
jgi:hypothetical protein